jgi:AAA+ ATPase superfamily predicted ATPase
MSKKIVMIISMFLCGNFAGMNADSIAIDQVPFVLSAEENEICQNLVAKFYNAKLSINDNMIYNINILKKKEANLSFAIKTQLDTKWLERLRMFAILAGPTIYSSGHFGCDLFNLQVYLNSKSDQRSYEKKSLVLDYEGILSNIGFILNKPVNFLHDIGNALGLPYHVIKYTITVVVPVMAFYGMYKMNSSIKNKQQELEAVKNIVNTLAAFGQPQ